MVVRGCAFFAVERFGLACPGYDLACATAKAGNGTLNHIALAQVAAPIWEQIARVHLLSQSRQDGLPPISEVGSWWSRRAQLDKEVIARCPHLLQIGHPRGGFFLGDTLPPGYKGAYTIGQVIAIAAFIIGWVEFGG